jgi:hypothetical protein
MRTECQARQPRPHLALMPASLLQADNMKGQLCHSADAMSICVPALQGEEGEEEGVASGDEAMSPSEKKLLKGLRR